MLNSALEPDLKAARRHLKLLTGEDEPSVTFQVFHDANKGRSDLAWHDSGTLDELLPRLKKAQRQGCGIFVCVNGTDGAGRSRGNIRMARAAYLDLDGAPLPDAWPIEPHLIIKTSPGRFGVFWALKPAADLEAWSDLQARLASFYGGDPSVTDPGRVCRLAGFYHRKTATPFQSRVVRADDSDDVLFCRRSISELADKHPCDYTAPQSRRADSRSDEPEGGWDNEADVTWAERWLRDEALPSVEGRGGDANAFRVACTLRDHGISERNALDLMLVRWNDRCEPPWDGDELEVKVANAYRYASGAAGSTSPVSDFVDIPIDPEWLEGDEPSAAESGHRAGGLSYIRADEVKQESIRWLWPNRFAIGKLNGLAGMPDQGKSQVTLSIAATVTRGAAWPDGGKADPGEVAILSAEDDEADTVAPRLEAAGADMSKVYLVRMLVRAKGGQRMFNVADDLNQLSSLIKKHPGIRLIIIDPITAYLGSSKTIDSFRNTDIRGVLSPLGDWAAKHGVAIIFLTHFSKGGKGPAIMRVLDSIAFVALSRAFWLVVPEEDNELGGLTGRKLLLKGKKNIGRDVGGLAYRIDGVTLPSGIETSRVQWDGSVNVTADDVLRESEQVRRGSPKLAAATAFLLKILENGAMASEEVKRRGKDEGHSEMTLKRAKDALPITAIQRGRAWYWELEIDSENAQV